MYGINTPLSEEYANLRVNKDINIEEGKTYLAYLTYNEKNKGYEIIGLEIGLREVQIPQETEYVSVINLDFEKTNILKKISFFLSSLYFIRIIFIYNIAR